MVLKRHSSDLKVVVRKAALRTFTLYLHHTNNIDLAFGYYIRNGLENNSVCISGYDVMMRRNLYDTRCVWPCRRCLMSLLVCIISLFVDVSRQARGLVENHSVFGRSDEGRRTGGC